MVLYVGLVALKDLGILGPEVRLFHSCISEGLVRTE